jgi:hypothetical protein
MDCTNQLNILNMAIVQSNPLSIRNVPTCISNKWLEKSFWHASAKGALGMPDSQSEYKIGNLFHRWPAQPANPFFG